MLSHSIIFHAVCVRTLRLNEKLFTSFYIFSHGKSCIRIMLTEVINALAKIYERQRQNPTRSNDMLSEF